MKKRTMAVAGIAFLLCVPAWASQGAGPAMKKLVTRNASFVLYAPEGWKAVESGTQGTLALAVSDPRGARRAWLVYGPWDGQDLEAPARRFLADRAKDTGAWKVSSAFASPDKSRLAWSGKVLGKAGAESGACGWLSTGGGRFCLSAIMAPAKDLDREKPLLLSILSNVRLTKGTFADGPGRRLVLYRLPDGSASFQAPEGWQVQPLGPGCFFAKDPSGDHAFLSASVEILSPAFGANVRGVPVSPFLNPGQAMPFLLQSQGWARDVRVQSVNPRPDIVGEIQRVYTAGPVSVEEVVYTMQTRTGRQKAYTFGISFGSRMGAGWRFWHLTAAAPESGFDAWAGVFAAMMKSYAIDDAFARKYVADGAARLARMQRQTSEIVRRNADEIHQTMQAAYEERQKSADYIDYQRSNVIRGQQDWVSEMEGGTVYHTDSWGTKNTATGETWEGKPYDTVHFEGANPKYAEDMTPIDSRGLYERHAR